LRSKQKRGARKERKTYFLNNEEKKTGIKDYVDRDTAMATKRVADAETAIKQEQEDTSNA